MNFILNGFIKIGQEEHINALYNEGLIHCNTLKYFKELENNVERRDEREGAIRSLPINKLQIKDRDKFVPINLTKGTMHLFDDDLYLTRVFCLFTIKPEHATGKVFIDSCNQEFGPKMLLINNPDEFINRVKSSLDKMQVKYKLRPVCYYDEDTHQSQLTVFHKPARFKHQSEFRLHIELKGDGKPFQFKIGSIADIAQILDSSVIPKLTIQKV